MSVSARGLGTFAEATQPKRRSYSEQVAWCVEHVPDEHAPFAVVAAMVVAYRGDKVTPVAVREQLRATGRARSQMGKAA